MNVGLALFTLNEETAIQNLLTGIQAQNVRFKYKVIVDDSNDATPDLARQAGYTVIPGGGSLGNAFTKAVDYFRDKDIDYLITLDGDGQADPTEMSRFLKTAYDQKADIVLGSRFREKGLIDYSYPFVNRFGVFLLSTYLRLETGHKITDSHGGVRCYSKQFLKDCRIKGRHTYVQESILHARDHKLKIQEIPSAWLTRMGGESRVIRSKLRYARKVTPILILRSKRCVPALLAGLAGGLLILMSF